jgi:hypothetical protein
VGLFDLCHKYILYLYLYSVVVPLAASISCFQPGHSVSPYRPTVNMLPHSHVEIPTLEIFCLARVHESDGCSLTQAREPSQDPQNFAREVNAGCIAVEMQE